MAVDETTLTATEASEASSFDCLLFSLLLDGVLLIVVAVFGMVGNTLTVATLWRKAKINSSSFILVVLAVVDIGVLASYTLMISVKALCDYAGGCVAYFNFSFLWLTAHFWPVATILHLCSTWVTVLVTFHRYVGVCYPHKYAAIADMKKTKLQVTAIFLFCILYNIPRFLDDAVKMSPDRSRLLFYRTSLGNNKVFGYVYNVGLYYLISYVLPFSALLHMVIHLIRALERSKEKRRKMTSVKREENDLTLTLITVVIVFMLCQVINPVRRALALTFPSVSTACSPASETLNFLSTLGIMLNSAVNFAIYCLCGRKFRAEMKAIVCCRNAVAAIETSTKASSSLRQETPAAPKTSHHSDRSSHEQ